jgi:hypothetical protein
MWLYVSGEGRTGQGAGPRDRAARVPPRREGYAARMSEIDPRNPSTLYAEGPVAEEPPEDDLPESSPLRDSGGTGPGPDDLDRLG